jgi:SAM-dependent methyltransferase
MSAIDKKVLGSFYRRAYDDPARLPWHRDTPSALLGKAVVARGNAGRALDLGCGAGVFSVWLARRGMQVTGIDLFPEAIRMARTAAEQGNVSLELVEGDLFQYLPEMGFDLVFDSGCLHSLVGGDTDAYKQRLLKWLVPDGEFVLEHWGKRHALDWRPVGPRRRSRATIEKMFGPELRLVDSDSTDFSAPLPFGPTVRGVAYWFRRVA